MLLKGKLLHIFFIMPYHKSEKHFPGGNLLLYIVLGRAFVN